MYYFRLGSFVKDCDISELHTGSLKARKVQCVLMNKVKRRNPKKVVMNKVKKRNPKKVVCLTIIRVITIISVLHCNMNDINYGKLVGYDVESFSCV